jgi:DNA-binding MarR family transcriptional regulator
MSVTRADVLRTLGTLKRAVGSRDLAEIMRAPSYRVTKSLTGLYARDLINRAPAFRGNEKFVYSAKAVRT